MLNDKNNVIMKTKIENAINTFISNNNNQVLVDEVHVSFPANAIVEYISSFTSSPYEENDTNTAVEWENEYQQWLVTREQSFEGNIVFEINNVRLKTTMFRYHFVDNQEVKIVVEELICTQR